MAFTGRLGSSDAQLGNFVLGYPSEITGVPPITEADASSSLSLSDESTSTLIEALTGDAESILSLSQESDWTGPLPLEEITSALSLTSEATADFGAYGRVAISTLEFTQEVDSNIRNLTALHEFIVLSDTARLAETYELETESIVSFNQSIATSGSLRYEAESSLEIEQFADNRAKQRAPQNTLELTQESDYEYVKTIQSQLSLTQEALQGFVNLQAENQIFLTQATRSTALELEAENLIGFEQTARANIRNLTAESTLELDQDHILSRPYYVNAESELTGTEIVFDPITLEPSEVPFGLDQEAIPQLASAERDAISYPSFATQATVVHILAGATDLTADNTLSLSDEALLNIAEEASNQLNMGVSADAFIGFSAETVWTPPTIEIEVYDPSTDTIELIEVEGQYAEFTIERGSSSSSSLDLKQSLSFQLIKDDTECIYTPFVGSSEDPNAPTPPNSNLPTQSFDPTSTRFKLVVPIFSEGSAQDSIILRAPEFRNTEGVAHTRVSRETSGRTLLVYKDPLWPEAYTMNCVWNGLKKTEALQLIRFISDNLGLEIGIQDHEGRCWRGTIVNPDEAVVEDHNDNFTASIQFDEVQRDPV